ncbi:MAG: hypothetical protein ACLP7P_15045 [Rhodomicrobium sp.]
MSIRSDLIVGWCPGALRPMKSGDGLIVRVRPRFSRLSLVQLETLELAAQRFGDGNLYLSNRANVQIRGVSAEEHATLLDVLAVANLIDSDPRIEAVRNIMVSPAVGLCAHAELAAGLVAKLEDALARDESLYQLPGKFGIAVQEGDEIDPASASDVTFLVSQDQIAMVLEGASGRAILFGNTRDATDGFVAVAGAFLRLRRAQPAIRRMRDAVATLGMDAVSREAGLFQAAHGVRAATRPAPVGDLGGAYGIGFAFGEIAQAALGELTGLMRQDCIAEAALSPHRALVFADHDREKAALQELSVRIGGITDPNDIRLRVHGCPGSPACLRATVEARRDAEAVMHALGGAAFPKGTIHISGCEKLCAYPHSADITAIGSNGRYIVTGPGPEPRIGVSGAELAAVIAELAGAA